MPTNQPAHDTAYTNRVRIDVGVGQSYGGHHLSPLRTFNLHPKGINVLGFLVKFSIFVFLSTYRLLINHTRLLFITTSDYLWATSPPLERKRRGRLNWWHHATRRWRQLLLLLNRTAYNNRTSNYITFSLSDRFRQCPAPCIIKWRLHYTDEEPPNRPFPLELVAIHDHLSSGIIVGSLERRNHFQPNIDNIRMFMYWLNWIDWISNSLAAPQPTITTTTIADDRLATNHHYLMATFFQMNRSRQY